MFYGFSRWKIFVKYALSCCCNVVEKQFFVFMNRKGFLGRRTSKYSIQCLEMFLQHLRNIKEGLKRRPFIFLSNFYLSVKCGFTTARVSDGEKRSEEQLHRRANHPDSDLGEKNIALKTYFATSSGFIY